MPKPPTLQRKGLELIAPAQPAGQQSLIFRALQHNTDPWPPAQQLCSGNRPDCYPPGLPVPILLHRLADHHRVEPRSRACHHLCHLIHRHGFARDEATLERHAHTAKLQARYSLLHRSSPLVKIFSAHCPHSWWPDAASCWFSHVLCLEAAS